ncbi:unnamed protein product [Closterium sp. NIES-53]
MASLRALAFDPEGRPVAFDTWHDDLQLYLLSDLKDSVSLFDHVSGATPAPPATTDVSTRSQWLSCDASARLAIRNHPPTTECAHLGEHRTAQALYDAVIAHYSSLAIAAIGRLLLPYLFLELLAFSTVADLVTHLRTSNARCRATVPAEFLPTNQPPMFITLYFIVTRLPDSLRSVRDHFLTLNPTSLTVDLLEQHLLATETSAVAVGAARGTPRSPFFEGCSPSPLSPSFASASAADVSGRERYFLMVVDDYTRHTTVFPMHSKGEVSAVLIPWIRTVRLQLREQFGQDLPVLRLHSDRGGEFSSDLLRDFCRGEGIRQTFTLSDSPQQNGIAECCIGLVMEVARTSMIHAAFPHFLWLFAVRYAAHELNLWPRVSLPKTLPTLRWTGKVGDASVFRVCVGRGRLAMRRCSGGPCAFVRDTSADKLSACAIPCVFLGFVPDAPGWQFYHPTSRRVLPSHDVTFDELVPFYRLFPYRSAPPPPPPLFLFSRSTSGRPPPALGACSIGSVSGELRSHFLDLLHAAAEEKNVIHVDQKQHQLLPLPLEKEALITAAGPESHLL